MTRCDACGQPLPGPDYTACEDSDCALCGVWVRVRPSATCDVCQHEAADIDASGSCAPCREHRQELESAGEVIARLAALLRRALPIVNGDQSYDWPEWELLARDIRDAIGDHKPSRP